MVRKKYRRTKRYRLLGKIVAAFCLVAILIVGVKNIDSYIENNSTIAVDSASVSYEQTNQTSTGYETCTLERVVDGDTLQVNIDGVSYKVRLIGVDTPESVHPDEEKNTEEGVVASDYTKSLLTEGQTLYLVKDTSDTDKYDRLLRYVWLTEPITNPTSEEVAEYMLNGILVANGYAEPKAYEPDTAYAKIFEDLAK